MERQQRLNQIRLSMKYSKILFIFLSILLSSHPLLARFYVGLETGYIHTKSTLSTATFELKNGTGVGAGVGVGAGAETATREENERHFNHNGGMINFILGTENLFFNNYFGIRWGIGVGSGFLIGDEYTLRIIDFNASFDTIINFYATEENSFGIFVGTEASLMLHRPSRIFEAGAIVDGRAYTVSNKTLTLGYPLRLGFTWLKSSHHRFELMGKIPLATSRNTASYNFRSYNNGQLVEANLGAFAFDFENLQVLLNYKYVY